MREVLYNDEFAFYLMPKCASSSLRETLPKHGYTRTQDPDFDIGDRRRIAIIREPLDRFLTAFITVERLSASKYVVKGDLLGNFVYTLFNFYKGMNQDYHYTPQSEFIDNKTELINFDNLKDDWSKLNTGIQLPIINKMQFKEEYEIVKGYLERHWELVGIIKSFYKEDYKLWQTAGNTG